MGFKVGDKVIAKPKKESGHHYGITTEHCVCEIESIFGDKLNVIPILVLDGHVNFYKAKEDVQAFRKGLLSSYTVEAKYFVLYKGDTTAKVDFKVLKRNLNKLNKAIQIRKEFSDYFELVDEHGNIVNVTFNDKLKYRLKEIKDHG